MSLIYGFLAQLIGIAAGGLVSIMTVYVVNPSPWQTVLIVLGSQAFYQSLAVGAWAYTSRSL